MKKIISLILVSILMLSAMTSLIFTASAEEATGNFDVLLSEDSERMPEEQKPPIPGYYYDENGFHTKSNGFKNFNPKFTVVSKEMYNIRNFSMTVVIHDYSVSGDNWFSFTLWSESNGFAMGDTSGKYGDGWTSVIRAREDGILNRFESWNQTKGGRSGKQSFVSIDNTQNAPLRFEPNVDEETGDITITFSIVDGVLYVNNMIVGTNTDKVIFSRFKNDMAYVGVTLYNTDSSGEHTPSISITDINGSVPQGSDSREPENKVREIGEMRDSATIGANTPALWLDGSLEKTNNDFPADTRYCEVAFSDDNMNFSVTAQNHVFYMQFDVPDAISYNASDFTYFAAIFKNYCTCNLGEDESLVYGCTNTSESLHIRYCAGNVTAANDDCIQKVESFYNVTPENSEDLYTVAVLPIVHDEWQGRINAIRLDFGNFESFFGVDGRNTFEIMFAGVFKTGEDVAGFVHSFRDMGFMASGISMDHGEGNCYHMDTNEDGVCDMCFEDIITEPEVPGGDEETTEPETNAPVVDPEDTSAPEETTEGDVVVPEESSEADTNAPEETTEGDVVVPEESSEAETNAPEETTVASDTTAAPEVTTEATVDTEAPEVTTAADTAAPEDTTEATVDTEAPADTTAKEEVTTKKEETTTKAPAASDDNKTEDKKGCGSSVAIGTLAIVAIVGTGVVLKKKED